jgi:outer membrane lipoprotein-sorting protein
MQALKSVHLALEIEGAAGSISGEGDIQLPYSMRLNLTTPEGTSEQLVVGGKMYMKVPDSDAYVALPSNPAILVIAASLMNIDAYVQNAQGATLVGDEQVGGVETKHVKFCYNADAVAATFFQSQGLPPPEPSTGDATLATGDIWVDRGSNYVRQYKFEVGSGADRQTTSLTLSKYNEPVSPPIEEPTNVQQLPDLLTPSP